MKHIKEFEEFINESTKWKTANVEWDELDPGDYVADGPNVGEVSKVISNTKKTLVLKRVWCKDHKHKIGEEFNVDWHHDAIKDHPKSIIKVLNYVDESVNESKNTYDIKDFPVGSIIHFNDGEAWKVVKTGMKGQHGGTSWDELSAKPYNDQAKKKNISLAIDFSIEYLNANVNKIEK